MVRDWKTRRLSRRYVGGLISLLALLAFVATAGGTLPGGTTFESSDGNLVKAAGTDWCNTVVANVCTATAPNLATGQDIIPAGNGPSTDDSFANGTKQDDVAPSVGTGGIPNKGDLDRFYVANELVNSNNYLYLGFELNRVSNTSASVHTGFEFNKNYCNPASPDPAVCSANNVTPKRSQNDILVVFDLEGGGNPTLTYRKWVLSGSCEISQDTAPCWGPAATLGSNEADGSLNNGAADITDPINPGAPRSIQQYRFGEAAINLTAANLLTGCAGLGSVYVVSRSSGDSGTATMKDFVAPKQININNCGTIVVKKVTDPNPDATDTSFAYSATNLTPTSFSLKNGGSTTYSGVNPGSGYAVSETVPTGWELASSTCDDGSPVSNISVSAGETVTCTFTNKLKPKVELKKVWSGTKGNVTLKIGTSSGGSQVDSEVLVGTDGTTGKNTVAVGSTEWFTETFDSPTVATDYVSTVTCVNTGGTDPTLPTAGSSYTGSFSISPNPGNDIVCTITNTRKQGNIELRKALDPTNDPGRFNLVIKKGAAGAGGTLDTEPNAGNGGTTGENTVDTGTYNVSENTTGATPATNLGDYVSTTECFVDVNGDSVKQAGEAAKTVSSGDVSVGYQEDVVCIITNVRKPKVELVKVWSGTAGNVLLKIGTTSGGSDVASTQLTGAGGTTTEKTATAGTTYYFSETFNNGSSAADYVSKVTCVNEGGGTTPTGLPSNADYTGEFTVTVNAGNDIKCTITNTRRTFSIAVFVCETTSGTPVLYSSTVTVDTVDKTSLSQAQLPSTPSGLAAGDLCRTADGAGYTGKSRGGHPANVNIP